MIDPNDPDGWREYVSDSYDVDLHRNLKEGDVCTDCPYDIDHPLYQSWQEDKRINLLLADASSD